ncbi:unnamed protein product, partial [Mesorhabditis spiculigera]
MPRSETTSPEDSGGFCCCLGSSRVKDEDHPVTFIKSEPIMTQPNGTAVAGPLDGEVSGIRTKTAEQTVDGFDDVSLETRPQPIVHQKVEPQTLATQETFNINDLNMDAMCTEEDDENGEHIVEDAPDIGNDVVEEVDEADLHKIHHIPQLARADTHSTGERSDEELTFKQMIAEDYYERTKKKLLKSMENETAEEENDSQKSYLNLDPANPEKDTGSVIVHNTDEKPSTSSSASESPREEPEPIIVHEKSYDDDLKKLEEREKLKESLMNEIETLDLEEVTGEVDRRWDEKLEHSERESKRAEEQFKEVIPQLSARSGSETDVESESEEEVMVDKHSSPSPPKIHPGSHMYSKMSESEDEESDEEEEPREILVPPPRKQHLEKRPESREDNQPNQNGNIRPDSSSEKENATITEEHVTRVSVKSNGHSTVVDSIGGHDAVRVALGSETQVTDDEFSEKLI